jgi:hypothetical protein
MFLIIAFIKSFTNEMLIVFLDIFGHEHKLETWFENFLAIFFPKYNLIMNSKVKECDS